MAVVLALVIVTGLARAIDPTVRLYLGDSAAYLAGSLSDTQLSRDRSFIYSLLLRVLVACLCLTVPLAVLRVHASWRTSMRPQAVLCAMATVSVITAHVLLINVALFRCLQPLPFLVWLHALPMIEQLAHRWNGLLGTDEAGRRGAPFEEQAAHKTDPRD